MNHDKKKKKNNNEHQQFEFCEVCRLNHNLGRRHNYFPSHKNSLSTFLARFQTKLADVKLLLRTPTRIRPEDAHQNRLRCVFCNCDILELDSQFACGNVIEHLASEEHWKRVKGFMWKYGGGMDRVDSFRISEVDYAKWEKKCKSLKTEVTKAEFIGLSNNIHNEHNTESINSFNKSNVDSLKFCIPNGVVPLHSYTNEETLVSSSVLSSVPEAGPPLHNISWGRQIRDAQYLKNSKGYPNNQHCSNSLASECLSNGSLNDGSAYSGARIGHGEISQGLLNLTQISSTSKVAMEGNVHTGAPPPWFDATKGDQLDPAQKPELSSKARKSKLNPKRVGAAWADRRRLELEMERRGELVSNKFDDNWLPNFGRVWQSGTRKESRKEFRMENKATIEADSQSETVMPLQPYVSKRMRKDTIQ
ncbi:hypothetical protein ACS0TY_007218 [Phlomoides rotata]